MMTAERSQQLIALRQALITDLAPKKCNTHSHPFRKERGMDGAQRFRTCIAIQNFWAGSISAKATRGMKIVD